jgi:glutaredoxin
MARQIHNIFTEDLRGGFSIVAFYRLGPVPEPGSAAARRAWCYHRIMIRHGILTVLLLAATQANAQAYRWVDPQGRVQFGDAPPANAKSVTRTGARPESAAEAPPQMPFEVMQAQKNFPVTLYTAPICKQYCEMARAALNRRGVPFTEVQVWNQETLEQLKTKAGSDNVPALVVGRSTQSGFDPVRFDSLLDSAGYPKLGSVPPRAQAAPPLPEGYEPPPTAEPVRAEADAGAKPGPYDTSKLPSNRKEGPGPYDTSKLPSNRSDKPGPYLTPGATK